jgi:hypothetical protein
MRARLPNGAAMRVLWHDLGMPAVLGNQRLADSAAEQIRQGEHVWGAIPATRTKMSTQVVSRLPFVRILLVPLHLVHLFKTPLRVIVWTDQRLLLMTRSNLLFTMHKARKIIGEFPKGLKIEGGLDAGVYTVTSLGKPLYVQEKWLGDMLRLDTQSRK